MGLGSMVMVTSAMVVGDIVVLGAAVATDGDSRALAMAVGG